MNILVVTHLSSCKYIVRATHMYVFIGEIECYNQYLHRGVCSITSFHVAYLCCRVCVRLFSVKLGVNTL